MNAEEKHFKKDDVIFREGEAGDAIYTIVEGLVDLVKIGPGGPLVIASLGQGAMFGEMGVLDDGPRDSSAVAVADSVVRLVPKADFRAWIAEDREAAARVVSYLVERLRRADDIAARLSVHHVGGGQKRFSLLDGLMALINRVRGGRAEEMDQTFFTIGIAAINNDIDGAWGRALGELLEGHPVLKGKYLTAMLPFAEILDQTQASGAQLRARQAMAEAGDVDVLAWGDVHSEGFSLMFTPAILADEERPGAFGPYFTLELSGGLEPPVGALFGLALLAAIEPRNEDQKVLQRRYLPGQMEELGSFLQSLPVDWNLEQQRTALICYGHAAATMGSWSDNVHWYEVAAEAYLGAQNRLDSHDHSLTPALYHRYRGAVLMELGTRKSESPLIENSVEEYRLSAQSVSRGAFPQEWAAAQYRLGQALNHIDHLTSQPDLLKEALAAFQSALQIYTRSEQPQRWADTMSALAELLLVYGNLMQNDQVLSRAVDAARGALEYRSRERNPALWAASQNALGTALFLRARHLKKADNLEEAAQALTNAAETYRSLSAVRKAETAERNLVHVKKLIEFEAKKKPITHDWASVEGSDEEAEPPTQP